jgi:hypothetical protein
MRLCDMDAVAHDHRHLSLVEDDDLLTRCAQINDDMSALHDNMCKMYTNEAGIYDANGELIRW